MRTQQGGEGGSTKSVQKRAGGRGVFEALSAHAKSLQNNPIFVNNLTKIGLSIYNGDAVVRNHDKNCNAEFFVYPLGHN